MIVTKPLLCLLQGLTAFVLIAEASPVKWDSDGGGATVGQLLIPQIHTLQLGDNVTFHCPPEQPLMNWCHATNVYSKRISETRTPCVEEGGLDHECAIESHMLTIHNVTEALNMTVWYGTAANQCNNLTWVIGRIHLLRLAGIDPEPTPSPTSSISKGPSCTPSTVTETATPCPIPTPTSCPPTKPITETATPCPTPTPTSCPPTKPNPHTESSGATSTSTVWAILLVATFSLITVTL